jgi:murein DD-endopeptidase MepM/ murein hydrolase activator NlpD
MTFYGEDIDPQALLNEVQKLFQAPASSTINPNITAGYQPPIKSNWANSGGFDASGALRPNGRRGHSGVDMRASGGTPIYPIAPGVVTSVGTDPLGGNVVNVQHENGVRSYYAHLSTAKVHKDDKVGYDTVLGAVGDTGNAKGTVPHLHFQVWKDNQLQNPNLYFNIPPYTQLSAAEKQQGPWVSDQAKQEAAAFSMQEHNKQRRLAFSRKTDQLLKCAYQFYKLVSG